LPHPRVLSLTPVLRSAQPHDGSTLIRGCAQDQAEMEP
jgi:hypothetical protein